MSDGIKRLLSVSSGSLAAERPNAVPSDELFSSAVARQLLDMLCMRNGFYAFHSALLVRAVSCQGAPLGIVEWNAPALWKAEYKTNLDRALFFAEDLFGNQFSIKDDVVQSFDAETGEFQVIGESIEDWANWVLEESEVRTAWPLAEQWGAAGRALEPGQRLVPQIPFVLGGEFELKNLYKLNEVESLRYRASITNQLRDSPDGSKVILKADWEPKS